MLKYRAIDRQPVCEPIFGLGRIVKSFRIPLDILRCSLLSFPLRIRNDDRGVQRRRVGPDRWFVGVGRPPVSKVESMELDRWNWQEGSQIMLVLSRKPGERILIGDDIVVTIVRIGPNNVRVGIEAPRDLNIVREELCGRKPVEVAKSPAPEAFKQVPTARH